MLNTFQCRYKGSLLKDLAIWRAEEISDIQLKLISFMFLPVLLTLHPAKAAYMSSSAAGRTRYILMFYSFEWVFHWHGYHDKASLTVLKGVSKDFCQGTLLWRKVSGCLSAIVQQCALVRFPILQAETRWQHFACDTWNVKGWDFWSLPWCLKRKMSKSVRYLTEAQMPCFKARFRETAPAWIISGCVRWEGLKKKLKGRHWISIWDV